MPIFLYLKIQINNTYYFSKKASSGVQNYFILFNMYILLIVLFYSVHRISLTYFSETKYVITITII